VSLEAGAKLQLLFVTGKNFLKFFLENLISISSRFLSSMSRIVARLAGCKSNKLFFFSQAFLNLFLKINFLLDFFSLVNVLKNLLAVAGAKVDPLFV
jgi:hypothetical protein